MRLRNFALLAGLPFVFLSGGCAAHRPEPVTAYRHATSGPWDLWSAIHKGFHGTVRYVGSEGAYSYFRSGEISPDHYKVRTKTLRLPVTFAYGHGTPPYVVTPAMVPHL
jgi:hypothetical protein